MKNNNTNPGKDAVTIISEGVVLEGKLSSKGNIRVDGIVKGDVNAAGNITIGKQGEINGEVNAQVVLHGGKINGTIKANEKIVLESTSNLKGDLITKILVVEEGAIFDGSSSMSDNKKIINPLPPEKTDK